MKQRVTLLVWAAQALGIPMKLRESYWMALTPLCSAEAKQPRAP